MSIPNIEKLANTLTAKYAKVKAMRKAEKKIYQLQKLASEDIVDAVATIIEHSEDFDLSPLKPSDEVPEVVNEVVVESEEDNLPYVGIDLVPFYLLQAKVLNDLGEAIYEVMPMEDIFSSILSEGQRAEEESEEGEEESEEGEEENSEESAEDEEECECGDEECSCEACITPDDCFQQAWYACELARLCLDTVEDASRNCLWFHEQTAWVHYTLSKIATNIGDLDNAIEAAQTAVGSLLEINALCHDVGFSQDTEPLVKAIQVLVEPLEMKIQGLKRMAAKIDDDEEARTVLSTRTEEAVLQLKESLTVGLAAVATAVGEASASLESLPFYRFGAKKALKAQIDSMLDLGKTFENTYEAVVGDGDYVAGEPRAPPAEAEEEAAEETKHESQE